MDWKKIRCTIILSLPLIQLEMLQLIQKKFLVSLLKTIMSDIIAICIHEFSVTSDVQNVITIEIDEYRVKVHSYFINGSDA